MTGRRIGIRPGGRLTYKPFDASVWPVTDCGLAGPVTLEPAVPLLMESK